MNKKTEEAPDLQAPSESPEIQDGVWPVMLTPFTSLGDIDWYGLDALIEWYIDAGVTGLFTVCLSSEMYELSPEERVQLTHHVVERVDGRRPVVAAGAFGQSTREQADAATRLYENGLTAVVLTVNQFAAESESEDVWRQRAEALFEACDNIPLGLYECPKPYHRTLSPEMLQWAAQTNRVFFYKDTCASSNLIPAKLSAVEDTPVAWFNAHAPTLLESLQAGGSGYSSIGANFIPALYVWLCNSFERAPTDAWRIQAFLTDAQQTIKNKYPASAKSFLQRIGLPITPYCRVECDALSETEFDALDALRKNADAWMRHRSP